jgi:hypothetical protein
MDVEMLNKDRSIFEGVYTLAKFYLSRSPQGKMNCISRTLGKFSIVDRNFDGTINDQDIWVCKIVREISPRENVGAFILQPIELVEPDRIKKIIPGFYDAQPMGKVISIIPNTDPHDYWMLSKNTRKIFNKRYHAVVVPIAYKENKGFEIKKVVYRVEKPEMLDVEPMQAKVKATQAIVKVVPKLDTANPVLFIDVINNKSYTWEELEPVDIKAENDSEALIAPVVKAKFGVVAKMG